MGSSAVIKRTGRIIRLQPSVEKPRCRQQRSPSVCFVRRPRAWPGRCRSSLPVPGASLGTCRCAAAVAVAATRMHASRLHTSTTRLMCQEESSSAGMTHHTQQQAPRRPWTTDLLAGQERTYLPDAAAVPQSRPAETRGSPHAHISLRSTERDSSTCARALQDTMQAESKTRSSLGERAVDST